MKAFKKIMALLLAVSMAFALCACGDKGGDSKDSGKANYQVKVLDGQGNALTSGFVVKFLKNGKMVEMAAPNNKGVASMKLAKGTYNVELMFTDLSIAGDYDAESAILTAKKTFLELSLIKTYDLVADGENYTAHIVTIGDTSVSVKANVRNYFVFTPDKGGTYEITTNDNSVKVGYYGSPYFVQKLSAIDVVNNTVTLSVNDSAIGGSYVFGLDGTSEDVECIFSLVRTGDPTVTISDLPWTEYKTTHTPTPYTFKGKNLKYIDVTGKASDNKLIFDDTDGFYHYGSASGPVVLVNLGVDAPYYSLQYIINPDGKLGQHGSKICEYFFDEDDKFIKKEDYSAILTKYFENMDQTTGVYPLTDDLKYIIQNGCKKWWDKNDPDYVADFAIPNCNPEIGWMFALCYEG